MLRVCRKTVIKHCASACLWRPRSLSFCFVADFFHSRPPPPTHPKTPSPPRARTRGFSQRHAPHKPRSHLISPVWPPIEPLCDSASLPPSSLAPCKQDPPAPHCIRTGTTDKRRKNKKLIKGKPHTKQHAPPSPTLTSICQTIVHLRARNEQQGRLTDAQRRIRPLVGEAAVPDIPNRQRTRTPPT